MENDTEFTNITSLIEGPCRLAIGPEGGFTEEELKMSDKYGFKTLKLGNTILRTETAAITGLITIKNRLS
jgi:RsmE family RNA methyltransferase